PWTGSTSFYGISFLAMLIGSTAEEIGWRGFLLPNLQKKHTPFVSSIIVGVLWGVWHLNFTGGITGFLLYTITIIEMSILMTWVYNRTVGNLFLMSLWHLTINIASHFFLWDRFGTELFIVESILFGTACVVLALMERSTHFFKRPLTEQ
ncbi:MAG TPA: CPBP family intramembrane glutamic endopeptidase, partial [Proteiniclasticum sp.]|nr:CPBP family intramembrane glutamic endopeptidase [Proteiniclasticum sp.]